MTFPQDAIINTIRPLDAQGNQAYTTTAAGSYQDLFIPHFTSFFPEYFLNAIQTETLMRDLSPIANDIYGTPHGAGTHPPDALAPANWITEDNLDAGQAAALGMGAADIPEFQAKAALRFYVAYAAQGVQAIDLFAAAGGGGDQLIPQSFFDAVDGDPEAFPGDAQGGLALQAVSRMVASLAGAEPIARPRQLTLDANASDNDSDVQFQGNGTAAFPPLYNRDVLAFFPFQVTTTRFVSAVYVMTRDVAQRYTSDPGPGQTPYDLPPETFRLTIGNVDAATARVSLTDPLTGTRDPATIIAREGERIVVALAATDSPRMLTIDDTPAAARVARRRVHGHHRARPHRSRRRRDRAVSGA
jgi:hypothetical protein